MTSTIIFKNNCRELSIIVSTWMDETEGVSKQVNMRVPPNTEVELKSDVGEWILGSLFYDEDSRYLWESHDLPFESRLAKFRNTPCAWGDYTWNFIDNRFDLVYENGVVTWSYKGESPPVTDIDQVD